jgi:hypothetical protein
MYIPESYSSLKSHFQQYIHEYFEAYTTGQRGFVANWLPEDAVAFPSRGILYLLEQRFGSEARRALNPQERIASPVSTQPNGAWLRHSNMVGINVRTAGSFFNVIKYALTLPTTQNSVHLLPIWEPGVVASLYGISSWNINPEFFSTELAEALPHLDTVEKQLRVTVNLLHLMGKSVGMDVIPHTDRYSEIALANPRFFEWLQRKDFDIVNHHSKLHEVIEQRILDWLIQEESALPHQGFPTDVRTFFGETFTGAQRIEVLFGPKIDLWGRIHRRNQLIQWLYDDGYEPVPATMAPPYRGIVVSRDAAAKTVDADGRIWRDYVLARPEAMSRVFGPLGRYKLYESKDENLDWEIDFEKPRRDVWQYVCEQYAHIAQAYDFDFMRGDMSHVQMRPDGVPAQTDFYYDIHKAVKQHLRQERPYFGYFAESFLAPPNVMAYGVEEDHLEASDADSTLGDLQSMVVGSTEFIEHFARYHAMLYTRSFAPNFTVITADKDDPRFDKFYLAGNETRLFMAFFLSDMPSYMSLGFETRDRHELRAPNECYTKLYVFQLREGANATHGPYQWGHNAALFSVITRLKHYADTVVPQLQGRAVRWLVPPSSTAANKVIVWTQAEHPTHLFVVNLDTTQPANSLVIPLHKTYFLRMQFSTTQSETPTDIHTSDTLKINTLAAGEAQAYQLI